MSKKEHLWSVIGHYGVVPFSYFATSFNKKTMRKV